MENTLAAGASQTSRAQPRSLAVAAIVAGAVQIAAGVLMYVSGVYFASWSMLVSVAVLLACIVIAIRQCAAGQSYRRALMVGFIVSATTGVMYAFYNMITINYVYPDFLGAVVRARLAATGGAEVTGAQVDAMRAQLSASGIAVGNLVRLTIVGTVMSAVIALLTNSRTLDRPLAERTR